MKRIGIGTVMVSMVAMLLLGSIVSMAHAQKSKTFVLNFNHLFPEVSWMHQDVVIPWKKMVEEKSQGRIKVNLFPGAALARPGTMYDAIQTGTIDVCLEPGPYYWGRFPMSQATQLPFLGARSSLAATLTWMDLLEKYPQLQKEYEETHLLWLFSQGPGQLFTNKPIEKMDDMKGVTVRAPGAQGDFIRAVGGSPVSMPASESYIGLQKGTLDATTFPGEAVRTWRLHEVTRYAVMGDFYVQWFFVTMNKAKYNSMPEDLKAVIDECSGRTGAVLTAKAWDKADKEGYALAKENGIQFIYLAKEQLDKWEKACQPLTDNWIKEMTEKGYPGADFIKDAKQLLEHYNQQQ